MAWSEWKKMGDSVFFNEDAKLIVQSTASIRYEQFVSGKSYVFSSSNQVGYCLIFREPQKVQIISGSSTGTVGYADGSVEVIGQNTTGIIKENVVMISAISTGTIKPIFTIL